MTLLWSALRPPSIQLQYQRKSDAVDIRADTTLGESSSASIGYLYMCFHHCSLVIACKQFTHEAAS